MPALLVTQRQHEKRTYVSKTKFTDEGYVIVMPRNLRDNALNGVISDSQRYHNQVSGMQLQFLA